MYLEKSVAIGHEGGGVIFVAIGAKVLLQGFWDHDYSLNSFRSVDLKSPLVSQYT